MIAFENLFHQHSTIYDELFESILYLVKYIINSGVTKSPQMLKKCILCLYFRLRMCWFKVINVKWPKFNFYRRHKHYKCWKKSVNLCFIFGLCTILLWIRIYKYGITFILSNGLINQSEYFLIIDRIIVRRMK